MTWVSELYFPELRMHCTIQSIFVHSTRSINFCGTRMTAVDIACRCRQAALPPGPELRRPQSCRPLQVASTSLSFVHSCLLSSHYRLVRFANSSKVLNQRICHLNHYGYLQRGLGQFRHRPGRESPRADRVQ
jgi:hypothetical protein